MADFVRPLTTEEIDYIIYGVDMERFKLYKETGDPQYQQDIPLLRMRPFSSNPVVNQSYLYNMQMLRKQLKEIKLYLPDDKRDENLEKFRMMITKKYLKSLIAPGSNVGIQAADALGAPITQITLNSFHNSGKRANSTTGIERMKEILHATRNMKARNGKIFFKDAPKNFQETLEYRKKLVDIRIIDLIDKESQILSYENFLEFIEANNKKWIFDKTFPQYTSEIYQNFVGVYKLDKYKMYTHRVTMFNIKKAILSNLTLDEIAIVYSDIYDPYIFIFYNNTKIKNHGIAKENTCFMFLSDFVYKKIFNIMIFKPNEIKKMFVSEINKSSNQIWVNKDPEYKSEDKPDTIYYAETEGINLLSVLGHSYVDSTRTFSNDPQQIKEVLGIEAARYSICDEIQNVIREAGDISIRHTLLLVDYMTYMGTITPISIIGATSKDEGTLLAASRVKATETIASSAITNEFDVQTSTLEIAFGSVPRVGPKTMDIYIDKEFKREPVLRDPEVPEIKDEEDTFTMINEEKRKSYENENVEFVLPKPRITVNSGNYNMNRLLDILKSVQYDKCES